MRRPGGCACYLGGHLHFVALSSKALHGGLVSLSAVLAAAATLDSRQRDGFLTKDRVAGDERAFGVKPLKKA